jgi:hypothetical protein
MDWSLWNDVHLQFGWSSQFMNSFTCEIVTNVNLPVNDLTQPQCAVKSDLSMLCTLLVLMITVHTPTASVYSTPQLIQCCWCCDSCVDQRVMEMHNWFVAYRHCVFIGRSCTAETYPKGTEIPRWNPDRHSNRICGIPKNYSLSVRGFMWSV